MNTELHTAPTDNPVRLANNFHACVIITAMAEALAVIRLVSAIVQFVDFGTKMVSRMSEFKSSASDVPKSFQDIMVELPLLLDTLKRTKEQAENGQVGEITQKALLPVVRGCQSQVELLNNVLVTMLPKAGDSSWKRGIKAFSSVRQEKKIEQITKTFRNYVQTLTYHQATSPSNLVLKPRKPAFMVPFERDPKFVERADIISENWAKISITAPDCTCRNRWCRVSCSDQYPVDYPESPHLFNVYS